VFATTKFLRRGGGRFVVGSCAVAQVLFDLEDHGLQPARDELPRHEAAFAVLPRPAHPHREGAGVHFNADGLDAGVLQRSPYLIIEKIFFEAAPGLCEQPGEVTWLGK
jgi:hypothetical protein